MYVSFEYDMDSKEYFVPITKRKYSNNLLGYLAIASSSGEEFYLKIVLIAKANIVASGYFVGTVQINDIFDCYTSSEKISLDIQVNNRAGSKLSQAIINNKVVITLKNLESWIFLESKFFYGSKINKLP